MPKQKVDGLIEAVTYTPDGKIDTVRAYLRTGAIWTDRLILTRTALVEKLNKGRHFVTGQRKLFFGSQMEPAHTIQIINNSVTTGEQPSPARDFLRGVPGL